MSRLQKSILALTVIASLCVFNGRPTSACGTNGGSFAVSASLNGLGVTPVFDLSGGIDNGTFLLYSKDEVANHFADQLRQPLAKFANSRSTTFSCVDARGDNSLLGTPGGDMGEMVAAVIAWFKMEQKPFNKADTKMLFDKFMNTIVTANRPFFFHTDDNRLRRMFVRLNTQSIKPIPSKLPLVGPSNAEEAEKWLNELVNPESQGCGHIRLQLTPQTAEGINVSEFYSVKLRGPNVVNCVGVAAGNCISSIDVVEEVIRLFYNYWWFTAPNSPQRAKTQLVVDVGPLVGKAVTIVGSTDYSGTCQFRHPLIFPNRGGSTLFVYHSDAVKEMRAFAVRQANLAPAGKRARMTRLWNDVAGMQLGATLTYLNPANSVGLFSVTVNTTAAVVGRKMMMM